MGDKYEKYVFLERSNRRHKIFFGGLSMMPCATAVNGFLGVLCGLSVFDETKRNETDETGFL